MFTGIGFLHQDVQLERRDTQGLHWFKIDGGFDVVVCVFVKAVEAAFYV